MYSQRQAWVCLVPDPSSQLSSFQLRLVLFLQAFEILIHHQLRAAFIQHIKDCCGTNVVASIFSGVDCPPLAQLGVPGAMVAVSIGFGGWLGARYLVVLRFRTATAQYTILRLSAGSRWTFDFAQRANTVIPSAFDGSSVTAHERCDCWPGVSRGLLSRLLVARRGAVRCSAVRSVQCVQCQYHILISKMQGAFCQLITA